LGEFGVGHIHQRLTLSDILVDCPELSNDPSVVVERPTFWAHSDRGLTVHQADREIVKHCALGNSCAEFGNAADVKHPRLWIKYIEAIHSWKRGSGSRRCRQYSAAGVIRSICAFVDDSGTLLVASVRRRISESDAATE